MSENKTERLMEILKGMQSAVIAYSGGVDSTFLLKATKLSGIRALAVTAASETMPEDDLFHAKRMAEEIGLEQKIIKTDEVNSEDFRKNPPDRCFYCKDELFKRLTEIAAFGGYRFVLDGSNLDDTDDWRPGRKAALIYGVRSPLIEAALTKKEIRELSRQLELPTWDRPSSPCLASRFPYGDPITRQKIKQVAEAEGFLRSCGFREFRVRHHGDIARIELKEEDFKRIFDPNTRSTIIEKLKSLGYRFVDIDLEGFRSGKMNEGIE